MTFLNPLVLFGLAAAALPLLIHLFNLRQPQQVDFSSLQFLKELEERTMQRVRVKQWLLLALRMLAIACLVLAFARPTLTGQMAGTVGQASTSWGVVIDNSLSMTMRDGQGGYLDQAKTLAADVLAAAEPDDEVFLFSTSQPDAADPPYRTISAAQQAVDDLDAEPGTSSLARSIAQAADALDEATHPNRQLYVFSDLQQSTLVDSIATDLPEDVGVTLVPVGERTHDNVAVTEVEVASRIVEAGQPVDIEATLVNYGTDPLEDYVASVYLAGDRVAQSTATLEPGLETTVTFTATPPAEHTGWLDGTVEVEESAFEHDDARHFTLQVPEQRDVLIVRGDGQQTRYLELALSSGLTDGDVVFQTETIEAGQLAATSLGSYEAVVLAGPDQLSSGEIGDLQRYVDEGGGIFFFPSADAEADDYNALFEALGAGEVTGFSGALGDSNVTASFDRVDLEHPLFEGVFDPTLEAGEVEVESPDIYHAMRYAPGGGSTQTLIELSNGDPFLEEVRHGAGVALIGSVAPDPEWSDWPLRGLFVPVLYRAMYYLSAGESVAGEELLAGQPGELRLSGIDETASVRLVGPQDEEIIPDQRSLFGAMLVETDASLRTPGIYEVYADDEFVQRVPLNLDPRISNLERAPAEEAAASLADVLRHEDVRPLDLQAGDEVRASDVVQARQAGTEIWNVFLLLALIFLLVEMIVSSLWKPESVPA